MAVEYRNSKCTPFEYGLSDWHHDPDGKVNYSWMAGHYGDPDNPTDFKKLAEETDNSYDGEGCTEQAIDNLMSGRHHQAEAFYEWEMIQEVYN